MCTCHIQTSRLKNVFEISGDQGNSFQGITSIRQIMGNGWQRGEKYRKREGL